MSTEYFSDDSRQTTTEVVKRLRKGSKMRGRSIRKKEKKM